jgi:hypothetical protein
MQQSPYLIPFPSSSSPSLVPGPQFPYYYIDSPSDSKESQIYCATCKLGRSIFGTVWRLGGNWAVIGVALL